jgi:hypothetical protein
MIGLFKRRATPPADTSALGVTALAMEVAPGSAIAAGCTAVLIDGGGRARRVEQVARLAPAAGETAWLFRPGPYQFDLRPFSAAAELGLRLRFAIDSADPRAAQQRFDLYLASEGGGGKAGHLQVLDCAGFFAAIEGAVQRELAQGHLDLPPCTSLAEWNRFRSGLDRLLYVRFGVTVDECLPVDLGEQIDFAAVLRQRAAAGEETLFASTGAQVVQPDTPVAAITPALTTPTLTASDDARCLRRLFLELPCLMCAVRVAVLPSGQEQFQRHQGLLRRLDLVSLAVTTMPALGLAAPGVALDLPAQARRTAHALRACVTLDEAWALLARLQREDVSDTGAGAIEPLFDDAERLVSNLECDVAGRRAIGEVAP